MKAHLLRAASAVALGCIAVPGPAQETSNSSEESTAAAPAVEVVSTVPVPGPGIDVIDLFAASKNIPKAFSA